MKSRIYLLSFFFFLVLVMSTVRVKAGSDTPDNYYNHYNNGNDSSLAVNYRVAFIEVAVVVIGVVIVRSTRGAINAKLKS